MSLKIDGLIVPTILIQAHLSRLMGQPVNLSGAVLFPSISLDVMWEANRPIKGSSASNREDQTI